MTPSALDTLLPGARLCELSHIDVGTSPDVTWELIRHGGMPQSRLTRALFAVRTLPERLTGHKPENLGRLDDLVSNRAAPGFQILIDDPPREIAVGAIGKVWQLRIPFVHVEDADEFARFDTPGWVKVAWSLRVVPRGTDESRIEFEVRVDATDAESWRRFQRYFRVIGIGSHWIRRSLLRRWQRALGAPGEHEVQPSA